MKKFDALVEGIRGVGRSKRYILLIYILNLTMALVVGIGLSTSISTSLGQSAASEALTNGFDDLWSRKFANDAQGFAATFDASVSGMGAVFNGLDSFLQGRILFADATLAGIGLVYLLMWTFFSGGLISLYASRHERPSFARESARFFPKMLTLTILAVAAYFLLFRYVFLGLTSLVNEMTRETIDERVHFTFTAVKYLIFWMLVWTVNMIFDYAKIVTVVKDPINMISAPFRGAAIVFGNLFKTYGLYTIIGGLWIIAMLFYWLVAPGAGQSTWPAVLGAFLIGQLYIISRIGVRCLFLSSQTALFLGQPSAPSQARNVSETQEASKRTA